MHATFLATCLAAACFTEGPVAERAVEPIVVYAGYDDVSPAAALDSRQPTRTHLRPVLVSTPSNVRTAGYRTVQAGGIQEAPELASPRLDLAVPPPSADVPPRLIPVVPGSPRATPLRTLPPAAVWSGPPSVVYRVPAVPYQGVAVVPGATTVYRPLVPVAPTGSVWVGRGLIGQPKAYVTGQPLRNAIRFISP